MCIAEDHLTAFAPTVVGQAFDSSNNTYTVLYDDGDVEEENLSKSKWRIEGTAAKQTPKAAGAAAGASKIPKAAAAGALRPAPPAHGPRGTAGGAVSGAHPQALVGHSIKIWQVDVNDWVAGDVTVSRAGQAGWLHPRQATGAAAFAVSCRVCCAGLSVGQV
jgi:hypothetical protein